MSWPFGDLPLFSFDFIMADPPWSFENYSEAGEAKNAKAKYDCMPLDAIKALPVGDLAAPNCLLMLWATNPMIPEAIETMRAWGFKYKTAGTWVKTTKHGKKAFGPGYILRCSSEPILIGTIGQPETSKNTRTSFEGIIREHSRKPEEGYAWAQNLMPNAFKRLDLFSRQKRDGWTNWGNEADKFNEVAA